MIELDESTRAMIKSMLEDVAPGIVMTRMPLEQVMGFVSNGDGCQVSYLAAPRAGVDNIRVREARYGEKVLTEIAFPVVTIDCYNFRELVVHPGGHGSYSVTATSAGKTGNQALTCHFTTNNPEGYRMQITFEYH